MWIPPQNIRNTYDSFAVASTLNELGLAEATIGVVGLDVYPRESTCIDLPLFEEEPKKTSPFLRGYPRK